jgi:uncharacterized protein YbjT (DUF2867 family)
MRVAVVGGTGLVGRRVLDAVASSGHEPVAVSRSTGVDVLTGDGLDGALARADAVVDVLNFAAQDRDEAETFFGASTANLLAAEARAGVRHHVLLSIVNVDRHEGNAHYAGKRRQEHLVREGSTPWTILRAAQFFEFADMVVSWTRDGDRAVVSPILVQPLAAGDCGAVLAELATSEPQHRTVDLVGPEPQDLIDMARRVVTARGKSMHLTPSWDDGPFGVECAGNAMLADPGARVAPTTFDDWLADIRPAS